LALAAVAGAQTATLSVDISASRSPSQSLVLADQAVNQIFARMHKLTASERKSVRWRTRTPFSMPALVRLMRSGTYLKAAPATRGVSGLTLSFDTTGTRTFSETYRAFLQTTFDTARATIDSVFGLPAIPGTVRVANFDADIADRDAVVGGYYLANNGSGQQEIRFPVYNNPEAAAVNFIHTILLAYLGDNGYAFDAAEEGLVRAAVATIVRTAGATSGLDADLIESVLFNTYEVGGLYDWHNQRPLSGPAFIAPNLRNAPLPTGGSVGGLYLLRYRMAGSAWEKVLAEYPGFPAGLNARVQADPTVGQTYANVVAASQLVLNDLRPTDPTIEGLTFADWARRQYVLQTTNTAGLNLLVGATPIASGLSGTDYGVFGLETAYFSRDRLGNETLLSGTSYPIYWENSFLNRISPSVQDEKIAIAGAYGSAAPNFTNDFNGNPYRVIVDVPVQDRLARVVLPAGAIATPSTQATPNDFYGTLTGFAEVANTALRVRAFAGTTQIADAPVTNAAFGVRINTPTYLRARALEVRVVRVGTTETTLLTRRVNKSAGDLALDLRLNEHTVLNLPISAGISGIGLPIEPYSADAPSILGLPAAGLLLSRYNASTAKYDSYPESGPLAAGFGFFHKRSAAASIDIAGRVAITTTAVALRPGWNMVTSPLNATVPTSQVRVVHATDFPDAYADATGINVGADFFTFVPNANDPVTGVPEGGTYQVATTFEAGKLYFVRCLVAEGASLVFDPSGTTRGRRPAVTPTWQMSITASGGGGTSVAIAGMSQTATRNFDRREDSDLPPNGGGFQLAIVDGRTAFRDTRPNGANDTYALRLDGLSKGKAYSLVFREKVGTRPTLALRDLAQNKRVAVKSGSRYAFTATGTTMNFQLIVGAGR